MRRSDLRPLVFAATLISLLFASLVAVAAAEDKEVRRSWTVKPGTEVDLENLAGRVRVEPGSADVVLVATFHAEARSDSAVRDLLSTLSIDAKEDGGRLRIHVRYPVEEHETFRYPGRHTEEHGFSFSFDFGSGSATHYQGRRVRVTSGSFSHGVTLWADLVLTVPPGSAVRVQNSVGRIAAQDVAGDLSLKSDAGDVRAEGGAGRSRIETGSGDVVVRSRRGDLDVGTGSGDVLVARLTGDGRIGTGSGDVQLEHVEGKRVAVHTGSGAVTFDRVSGSIEVETGSGDISSRELSGAEDVSAETGSGDVAIAGDLTGLKRMRINTSSGEVHVSTGKTVPMKIRAKTTSGDVDVDLPDVRTIERREHLFVAEVAGGGADVRIDTTSGNVRIDR